LQRIKLRDDFTINQVDSLTCVYLSKTEHYPLDCFIGQYITTRNLHSIATIGNLLRTTLERYPGKPPVMVNELNAWIGQYVAEMDVVQDSVKRRRPLRQAQVIVEDVEGNPGWYKVDLRVRPHFKYMGAFFSLSLVGKLDKK